MVLNFLKNGRKVIAICIVLMLAFSSMPMAANPAQSSLWDELAERIEGSPFEAISILLESLENGVTAVDADWLSWRNDEEKLAFRFYSNAEAQEYALNFEMVDRWDHIDFMAFLNQERVAVSSPFWGDDALGIVFNTFGEDLLAFVDGLYAREIIDELPEAFELDTLIEYVRHFEEIVFSEAIQDASRLDLMAWWLPFMRHVDQTTEWVTLNSVQAQRASFSTDMDTLLEMYIAAIDRFGEDNPLMDDVRRGIEEIGDTFDYGTFNFVTYTARGGRLLQVGVDLFVTETWINWRDEEVTDSHGVSMVLNLGRHARDTWTLELSFGGPNRVWRDAVIIAWEIHAPCANSIEHRFVSRSVTARDRLVSEYLLYTFMELHEEAWEITWDDDVAAKWDAFLSEYWDDTIQSMVVVDEDTFTLGVGWNRESGELVLFYEETGRWEGSDSITGTFTMDDYSFALQFNEEDFNFKAYATIGVTVPTTDFINLDQWADLDYLLEIWDMFFGAASVTHHHVANMHFPTAYCDAVERVEFDWDAFDWDAFDWDEFGMDVCQMAFGWCTCLPCECGNLGQNVELLFIPAMPEPVVVEGDMVVEKYTPVATNIAVVANCVFLHIRTGPGAGYAAFNHLVVGDIVIVLEQVGDWTRVETDHGIGWVSSAYLEVR